MDCASANGLIDDDDLLAGWGVVAHFAVDRDNVARYTHFFPDGTPHHAAIGLMHTAIANIIKDTDEM